MRYNSPCVCGRSSSGRARPCQGRGSEFEPRRPLQKKKDTHTGVFLFLERRFCAAKSVACGRVIEREWGNPSKVSPSHSPFLAVGGGALICLRRVTFFHWRKKVTKERHLRKGGFRFPPFLKNPIPLKRPNGKGVRALPFGNPHPGVGDYQIAPLPQSGKGRWRPVAAV